MKSILFICTGNVFRSMTAEYALRRALAADPRFEVSSAGTDGGPHTVWPEVREYLLSLGLDVSGHTPRRLTRAMVEEADLVIAMSVDHRDFIEREWGLKVPVFNEFCHGECTPLHDIDEVIEGWQNEREKCRDFAAWTIRYIIDSIPNLVRSLERWEQSSKR